MVPKTKVNNAGLTSSGVPKTIGSVLEQGFTHLKTFQARLAAISFILVQSYKIKYVVRENVNKLFFVKKQDQLF